MIPYCILLGSSLAVAGDDVIELPPVEPLPSVVETFEEAAKQLTRQRFGFRPEVSVAWRIPQPGVDDSGAVGARLGGTFLHHWWTVPPGKQVRWSGETTVGATGLVGGVRGWEVALNVSVGPWLGPLRIGVGPSLRSDRTVIPKTDEALTAALLIGPRAGFVADTGPLLLWANAAPMWSVAGQRTAWQGSVTELEVVGGIAGRFQLAQFVKLQLGLRTRARLTEMGTVLDMGLTLHLGLGVSR
jgi:hypothetical protein